jgi:D-arabinose 1-dehydrogenase-like Zn-dependent alcohol dehydrogenase
MQAARFHQAGEPLIIETLPDPRPGPGEVIVLIQAAGVCGTDVHIALEGTVPTARQPITLGHEGAGIVMEVGAGIDAWREGDRVCLMPHVACGECHYCAQGEEALCPNTQILGVHIDGVFAERTKISADSLVALPDEIPFEIGAILTDAVSTAYHAVTCRGRLQAGESVAIIGCGGLGYHGLLWAQHHGADKTIAIDLSAEALARAERVGADIILDARGGGTPKKVKALTDGLGVDLALEFVGQAETVIEGLKSLRRGGRLVVVGVGPERVTLPPMQVFVGVEAAILGSMGFHRADLEKVIRLVAKDQVDLSRSVAQIMPLSEVNEAIDRVANQSYKGARVVLAPGGDGS